MRFTGSRKDLHIDAAKHWARQRRDFLAPREFDAGLVFADPRCTPSGSQSPRARCSASTFSATQPAKSRVRNSPTLPVPCPAARSAASKAMEIMASATITSISVKAAARSERRRAMNLSRDRAHAAARRRPGQMGGRARQWTSSMVKTGGAYGQNSRRSASCGCIFSTRRPEMIMPPAATVRSRNKSLSRISNQPAPSVELKNRACRFAGGPARWPSPVTPRFRRCQVDQLREPFRLDTQEPARVGSRNDADKSDQQSHDQHHDQHLDQRKAAA